jgi:hypothetical protein
VKVVGMIGGVWQTYRRNCGELGEFEDILNGGFGGIDRRRLYEGRANHIYSERSGLTLWLLLLSGSRQKGLLNLDSWM